ncbi:MAG: S8 family serine peptidase, partial [Chloroflexota bacterium]
MRTLRTGLLMLLIWLVAGAAPLMADPKLPEPALRAGGSPVAAHELPLAARQKIEPELVRALLRAQGQADGAAGSAAPTVTFLVYMREQAEMAPIAKLASTLQRRQLVAHTLQETARRSQVGVLALLEAQRAAGRIADYRSYWAFNGLAVDGDLQAAIALALRPDVEALRANRVHHLPVRVGGDALLADAAWNIQKIGADRVWSTFGVTGKGVVVASLDSGVDWTHPALRSSYRGYNAQVPSATTHDYHWFDFTGTYRRAPGPNRPRISGASDHGTHTMGTLVGVEPSGANAIGVAPGARWIAVKVFDDFGSTTDERLHAGFQWCLAPTDLDGRNPNPALAPDVVNNSWGDDDGADVTFAQDLRAWQAAGILSVWAAGNSGPNPGTINAPASLRGALAVGATDSQDIIAGTSSRGPTFWGDIKPDVAAPGVNIRSSIAGGSYEGGWNGTSMATPHVAGVAALLLEASNHGLSIAATQEVITRTALDLGAVGRDNAYGYGRVDAYQAVATVFTGGTFAGRVVEQAGGAPVAGAVIALRNRATGGGTSGVTAADGSYLIQVAAGRYDVEATKFGYARERVEDIGIVVQRTTQLDFRLAKLPQGTLYGRVSAPGGAVVPCTVQLEGTPASATIDAAGNYTLTVPAGAYAVRVVPGRLGYRGARATAVQVPAGGSLRQDWTLSAAPKLLVVDADAWNGAQVLSYYAQTLDDLTYAYATLSLSQLDSVDDSLSDLANYDLVIWAQARTSPGYMEAWPALGAYLKGGGRLFISGENIGYWDVGEENAPTAYREYLHADYVNDDGGLGGLTGVVGSPLAGTALAFNTADSARNQSDPDSVVAADAAAAPTVAYASGMPAGLAIEACAYRAIYLAFGLEGVGPAEARQSVLQAAIAWLSASPERRGLLAEATPTNQGVLAATPARYAIRIENRGTAPERYGLSLAASPWPARILDLATRQPVAETAVVAPCESATVALEVTPPRYAAAYAPTTTGLRISPVSRPADAATLPVQTMAFPGWESRTALPAAAYNLGAARVGCILYAVGGLDADDEVMAPVRRLDLVAETWSLGRGKPTPSASSGVAQVGGLIYAVGGIGAGPEYPFLSAVDVYDPATDSWRAAAPLPLALSGMGVTTTGGRVYSFGGRG